MKKQKAYIIAIDDDRQVRGLDDLNLALGRGWSFVQATPFGGGPGTGAGSGCLAALVVVEREDRASEAFLEIVEEETDELIDDLLEGDGSNRDLDIDPEA